MSHVIFIMRYQGRIRMGYLSFEFLIFTITIFTFYYTMPKKYQWILMLATSFIFYASYDVKGFLFLFFSILTTYVTAIWIEKDRTYAKWIIFLCILVNLFVWFMIKDFNWIANTLNRVFIKLDFTMTIPSLNILIPIGISYYLLQTIAYILDVYKRKTVSEKNILKYALFVSWFPAIVQGPISRFNQLSQQFFEKHSFNYDSMVQNLLLILYGLVKKLVIADQLAIFANYCFTDYQNLYGFTLYAGAIIYSLQLYMDFSACVNICRGVSGLFGIELVQNFRSPYFAKSIKEFWGRWHISLSSWLKDYIYIPLGGNRKGKMRQYINIGITFMISGIWHGAGFGFIIWGLLHAVYQIAGDMLKGLRTSIKKLISLEEGSISDNILKTFTTFHLVAFAWIFFRSASLKASLIYIRNMLMYFNPWVLLDDSLFGSWINSNLFLIILINIVMVFIIEYKQTKQMKDFVIKLETCM